MRIYKLSIALISFPICVFSQVGIGTTSPSEAFDVETETATERKCF